MPEAASKTLDILLAEDSEADTRLVREAFLEGRLDVRLHTARDGAEALAFLRREPPFEEAPEPDLIILDLNMPRMNGREFLAKVKEHSRWQHIPVVVFSTSQADKDVVESYRLHANCFVVKPVALDDFLNAVHCIEHFWLERARLPGR